jgi:hypothetical protein
LLDIAFTKLSQDERSYDPDPHFDANNFAWCLGQVVPYAARWWQFVMEGVSVGMVAHHVFSPLAELYAPALERMVIDCHFNPPEILEVFSVGAPLLSYMELMEVYFVPPPDTVTSLKLRIRRGQLSYTDFNHLMSHMRSLTHLSLYANIVGIYDLATAAHHHPIELPSVLSLDLELHSSTMRYPSVGALCFLDLPALETLVVHGTTVDIVEGFTSHRRSYLALRTLTFTSPFKFGYEAIQSAEIREFIHLFPNVRDFIIDGTHPTFLRPLCEAQTTDGSLWPQLSVITLKCQPVQPSLTLKDIIHLVENRATLGHPISRITLSSYFVRRATRKEQEQLKKLVELEEC